MPFLVVEGGQTLINLDLIDRVELVETKQTANLWAGGVLIAASTVAFEYFARNWNNPAVVAVVGPEPATEVAPTA